MRPASPTPTPQELEILKVVWDRGPVRVRDVYELLRTRRRVAYTTVMTMMGVLERKGHLTRHAEGRSYVYAPARSRKRVVGAMVREFLDRVFGGSARPLLVHLVDEHRLSGQDLAALAREVRRRR